MLVHFSSSLLLSLLFCFQEVREIAAVNLLRDVATLEEESFRLFRHVCVKKAKKCKRAEVDEFYIDRTAFRSEPEL